MGTNGSSVYSLDQYVEAGGLISYGPNLLDLHSRSAAFVDKLLRGAKAADLPVEMVVNLKTARALGLTLPQSILLLANRAIE